MAPSTLFKGGISELTRSLPIGLVVAADSGQFGAVLAWNVFPSGLSRSGGISLAHLDMQVALPVASAYSR